MLQEAPEAVSSLTQEVELLETRPSYRGPAHRSSFSKCFNLSSAFKVQR